MHSNLLRLVLVDRVEVRTEGCHPCSEPGFVQPASSVSEKHGNEPGSTRKPVSGIVCYMRPAVQ